MRVLIYGASIAQGFYDAEGGWVGRLWKYYIEKQLTNPDSSDITIFNMAISGDSSSRLLKRFKNETVARKFPGQDFCLVFSIGTNNAWVRADNSPSLSPEQYAEDLKLLIKQARDYTQKIMFIGIPPCDEQRSSPVPWNKDIFFSNQRLKLFDQALSQVCESEKVNYLPTFEIILQRMSQDQIYQDGLHPNSKGHQLIFELVQPELDKLLND